MLSGFFGKVFGGFVAVVLAAGMLVYFFALPGIEQQVYRGVERRVAQEAELVAELVRSSWDSNASRFNMSSLKALSARLAESRITIIDVEGAVLFDSHQDAATMDNHLDRAEIQSLQRPVTRFSDTLGKTMVYQACPVRIDGRVQAFARVAISTEDRDRGAAQLHAAARTGVLVACLIALALAFVIARLVSRPLTMISDHVGQLGKGSARERLRVSGGREFARLAVSLNTMSDEIELRIAMAKADKIEREAILSAMTDGLVAVDLDLKVLFINGSARALLCAQRARLEGVPIWELNRAPSWNELIEELRLSAGAGGGARTAECRLQGPGGERQLEVTAVRFSAPDVARQGSVCVLRDVTELRRLEAVRRDFVSNVSHELKTPLTAIRGYLDVILGDPKLPAEELRRFLQRALRNTEQLAEIVSDLLSLARLESGQHNLSFEPLQVSVLLELAAEGSRDLAESKRMQANFETPTEPIVVMGDQQALLMALFNLITNAIRYSEEGSSMGVRAYLRPREKAKGAQKAVIEVRDEGPGIPPEERERIFERFYRVDRVRTRSLGGTGLGLAIVKHVMAIHGGRVELESELGKGSIFRLVLDCADPDAPA